MSSQVLNPSAHESTSRRFCENLGIFMKSDFLKSNYMKSRGVKYHPWSLLTSQEVSIRVLVHFQDHWFLMISNGFLVDFWRSCGVPWRRVLRTPSHPQDEWPKFVANGVFKWHVLRICLISGALALHVVLYGAKHSPWCWEFAVWEIATYGANMADIGL